MSDNPTCEQCFAEFLEPGDLVRHVTQAHVGQNQQKLCQFCARLYSDLETYARHIRDSHITGLIACKMCRRVFPDHQQLTTHEKRHKANSSLKSCSQCPELFSDLFQLENHEFTNHKDEEGIFLNNCLPYLSGLLNTNAASFLQSLSSPSTYRCIKCKFSTYNVFTYINHLQKNTCRCYVCDKCSNVYSRRSGVTVHIQTNPNCIKPQGLTCKICHTSVKRHELAKHKKTCKKTIECIPCNTKFSDCESLSKHLKEIHPTKLRVQTCKYCQAEFVGKPTLLKHIDRTHKNETHLYIYKCKECNLIFKHPQKLFAHFFTKHPDLKPYTCKICNKQFKLRKQFTVHIKLEHASIGSVTFDDNFHVLFTESKTGETPRVIPDHDYTARIVDTPVQNVTIQDSTESTDEDTPLVHLAKQGVKKIRKSQTKIQRNKSKPFTCRICNKYCYTYLNFNRHMALHHKKEYKPCIKCNKPFKTIQELNSHLKSAHSQSSLTSKLQEILARKKCAPISLKTERFRASMIKVDVQQTPAAQIKLVNKNLSARKFFETFIPDSEKISIETSVTVKPVKCELREPKIIMHKFKEAPVVEKGLAKPIRFTPTEDCHKATMKLVEAGSQETEAINKELNEIEMEPEKKLDVDIDKVKVMVKQNVLLPHIKDLNLKVAHLLPEAPYYKIVKVNEILDQTKTSDEKPILSLPEGKKLVNVNPLAHLMKELPPSLGRKGKKQQNYEQAVTKAMLALERPKRERRKVQEK